MLGRQLAHKAQEPKARTLAWPWVEYWQRFTDVPPASSSISYHDKCDGDTSSSLALADQRPGTESLASDMSSSCTEQPGAKPCEGRAGLI